MTTHARSDERGVVLVVVALSMTALLILAALVLDGGQGYADHRNTQNAADAAAMAGARALLRAQQGILGYVPGTLTDPYTQALTEAATYGAVPPTDSEQFCTVIDASGNPFGDGNCQNSTTVDNTSAAGVAIVVEHSAATFFGSFANRASQITRGRAAATVQLMGSFAPWVVCGGGLLDGQVPPIMGWNMLDGPSTNPTLDVPRSLLLYGINNPNGLGVNYPNYPSSPPLVVHQNNPQNTNVSCQVGPSPPFPPQNGSVDGTGNEGFVSAAGQTCNLPCTVGVQPGNGKNAGSINDSVPPSGPLEYWCTTCGSPPTGAIENLPAPGIGTPIPCGTDVSVKALQAKDATYGCDIVLPIADYANGNGNNAYYHVVAFGIFRIIPAAGNDKINAWFEGPANGSNEFTQNPGSSLNCSTGPGTCVVKLIQ